VKVSDAGAGKAEISWMVVLDINEEGCELFTGFLKQTLSDGIDGIERDLQSAQQ
jgi:hypothetical protein